jgi:hypothetical protein
MVEGRLAAFTPSRQPYMQNIYFYFSVREVRRIER